MNTIEKFYKKTRYFWIVSRVLLILIFIYPIFKISKDADLINNIINSTCMIYVILMLIILIKEISKKNTHNLKIYTGILSLFYGIIMSVFLIKLETEFSTMSVIYFQLIPLWIILFGIWELKNSELKTK